MADNNSRAHTTPRWTKTVARHVFVLTVATTATAFLSASPAHAEHATTPVAAGDTLVHAGRKCTLGYVYRVKGHTLGVSAGHCATGNGPVDDTDAGVTGRTVSATYIPGPADDQPPRKDWWLIDFGDVPWSDYIANRYKVITYVLAQKSEPVCHWGITSGETCGTVTDATPPLITVTQTGDPGDSGGPTYIKIGDNEVALVGLWQGHLDTPHQVGYAMSLPVALDWFRESSE